MVILVMWAGLKIMSQKNIYVKNDKSMNDAAHLCNCEFHVAYRNKTRFHRYAL